MWVKRAGRTRHNPTHTTHVRARVLLASSLLATAGVGILGAQVTSGYSLFTATPHTLNFPVNLAQASLAIGTGSATSIGIPITNLVPGETQSRAVTLNNNGQLNFGALTMKVTGGSGALVSSGALELGVALCTSTPVASTSAGVSCSSTTVLPAQAVSQLVSGSAIALTPTTKSGVACSWDVCMQGKSSTILISVTLASSAPSSVFGTSTALNFAFTGEGIS